MPTPLKATYKDIGFEALLFEAAPKSEKPPEKPSIKPVLFCMPGGGAARGFFDLAPGNSFAKLMNGRGYDVITMDHPGTASNPLPEGHGFLTPRISADYINWALKSFIEHQRVKDRDIIGIGHSMGGMMATLIQARHKPFKALALLGSSAGGLDWGLTAEEQAYKNKPEALERDLEKLTLTKFKSEFPGAPGGGPSGKSIVFGGETESLTEALRQNTCELFAAGGMMSMVRGSFKKEVEALDIPIFFAFGDHDIGIPPEDVPKDYVNAASTKMVILERTGHNHMAFGSIEVLTRELGAWVDGV